MNYSELLMAIEIGLIYSLATIGVWFTFKIIDFADLTCDGSFVLGAVVSAVLIKAGVNPIIALLISAFVGGLSGLCTGALFLYCKVSAILSGILVAFMLYSVNLKIMSGIPNIALVNFSTIFDLGWLFIISLIIGIVIILIMLLSTDFGLALRSIGQNKRLAFNNGVNISFFTLVGLCLSNSLIGLSGGLFCQQQGFADVSQGVGTIIICFASMMLGEKIFPQKKIWFNIISCVIGSVIYRILIALALHSEWIMLPTEDLNLLTGLLVILCMRVPNFRVGNKKC